MSKYEWEEWMGEISGFGGGYEQTCRDMLFAGLKWLEDNPDNDPKFVSSPNIFGVVDTMNADAKDLEETLIAAADNDCTGAMLHAVLSHVLYIRSNGWEAYQREMDMRIEHGEDWRAVKEEKEKEAARRGKEMVGKSILDVLEEAGADIIELESVEAVTREINRRIRGDA